VTSTVRDRALQLPTDTSWHRLGACTKEDSELFFHPMNESGPAKAKRIAAAVDICQACPVLERCRTENMHEQFGIWGGLSEEERDAIRKGERAKTAGLHIVPVSKVRLPTKGQGLDPGPVASHAARLVEAGATPTAIAAFAGLSPETVRGLLRGTTQHITSITAQKLLSVQVRRVAA